MPAAAHSLDWKHKHLCLVWLFPAVWRLRHVTCDSWQVAITPGSLCIRAPNPAAAATAAVRFLAFPPSVCVCFASVGLFAGGVGRFGGYWVGHSAGLSPHGGFLCWGFCGLGISLCQSPFAEQALRQVQHQHSSRKPGALRCSWLVCECGPPSDGRGG